MVGLIPMVLSAASDSRSKPYHGGLVVKQWKLFRDCFDSVRLFLHTALEIFSDIKRKKGKYIFYFIFLNDKGHAKSSQNKHMKGCLGSQ
jgi:hypothetical protein